MPTVIGGVVLTVGVVAAQVIFPFAFDFVTTLGVYAVGVIVGRNSQK